MNDSHLKFSRAEYAERLARTRAAMAEQELDLLIVSDPSNMAWLTGYDGWSFYVHQCVLVSHEGEPVWYGRLQDANGARRTAYLQDDNILSYPDPTMCNPPDHHPMDLLAAIIESRGFDKARIGVELDNYYFTAAAYAALTTHLPNALFLDATRAGELASRHQERGRDSVSCARPRASSRQCTSVSWKRRSRASANAIWSRRIYDVGIRGVSETGGDYPAIVPLLPSGPRCRRAASHLERPAAAQGRGDIFSRLRAA